MSKVSCESCDDLIEVFGNVLQLPYICVRCEKDSALAIEQDVWEAEYVGPACQQAAEELHGLYIEEKDNIPCDAPYNSGVPCQSALDSVQADVYDIQDAHNADVLDQFDEDTKLIDDLRLQLEQANLNVQILEETIEDLENQLTDLRLDICNVMFRTHF
jgi:chromosome segregation ATPase